MGLDEILNSIATGYKTSTVLFWVTITIVFINFIWTVFNKLLITHIKKLMGNKKSFIIPTLITLTLLTGSQAASAGYETMISITYLTGAIICAFFAVNFTKIPEPFKTSLQLLLFMFSLMFVMNSFGSTVLIAQTNASQAVTDSVAMGYKTSTTLFWFSTFILATFLIWFIFNHFKKMITNTQTPNVMPPNYGKGKF